MTPRHERPMRGRARALLLIPLLGAVAACPRPAPRVPQLGSVEAGTLLERLQAASALRRQAVGLLRLDYVGTDGLFRGEADVAVARPRRLRIELRSFFNQPAGALACDGEHFAYVDATTGRTAQGGLQDPALRALLPLGLDLDSTVAGLLGGLPEMGEGPTRYVAPAEPGHLALRHEDADGAWLLELEDQARRLLELRRLDRQGQELLRLRFGDHQAQPGLPFPRRGEARVQGRAGELHWAWQEVELDGEALPPEAWQLLATAGRSVDSSPVD